MQTVEPKRRRTDLNRLSSCGFIARSALVRTLECLEAQGFPIIWLVLRVKYEGLIAPECCHWTTTSHGASYRFGESIRWVWKASLAAVRSGWLVVVARSRCVFELMERPVSSSFFRCVPVQSMMQCTNPYKLFTWMGSFGVPFPGRRFCLRLCRGGPIGV